MANKNPKNQFKVGNQFGRLAKGIPKPTLHVDFQSFYKNTLGKFTQEEIDAMIESLPAERKLFFLVEFANQQKQHEQFLLKQQMELMKMEQEKNEAPKREVIEIGYIDITPPKNENE